LVSDREHAPYFAEQAILHQLSMIPSRAPPASGRTPLPPLVWLILSFEAVLLLLVLRLCKHLLSPAGPAVMAGP
jgi:hypothetical protein